MTDIKRQLLVRKKNGSTWRGLPLTVYKDGYARVKCIDHPEFGTRWIRRSHYVWWTYRRQRVKRGWCLHHKDEDILHDVVSNLQLMTTGEHVRLHKLGEKLGPLTVAHRTNIAASLKGKPKSKLHKLHLRKPESVAGRRNIATSNRMRVYTTDMLCRMSREGMVHSKATRLKMSRSSKGKPKSEQHKLNIRRSWRFRREDAKYAQLWT